MTHTVLARSSLLAAVLAVGGHARIAAQHGTTTVIVVRHAEKAAEPASDPGLTPEGMSRARALVAAVAGAGIDAIYSTQFARTRGTAEPLARELGVPVTVMDYGTAPAAGGVAAYTRRLAELIRNAHRGGTVLVVGHSNTVPALIEALGAPAIGTIEDHEYDHLFVVFVRPDGSARTVRAKYGERSPPG